MPASTPTHADADLVLKLYDLRREPLMRASRATILRWIPLSFEDVRELMKLEHPDNAAWRQVSSYFEYAFGFARHGIVPPDFLAEYNAEGLLLYAKLEPFLPQLRAEVSATAFGNAEWVVEHSPWARERLVLLRKRLEGMRAAAAAAPAKGGGKTKGGKHKPRKQAGKGARKPSKAKRK